MQNRANEVILAAKDLKYQPISTGALAHSLLRCTACNIQSGHRGYSKLLVGSGKSSTPWLFGARSNFLGRNGAARVVFLYSTGWPC